MFASGLHAQLHQRAPLPDRHRAVVRDGQARIGLVGAPRRLDELPFAQHVDDPARLAQEPLQHPGGQLAVGALQFALDQRQVQPVHALGAEILLEPAKRPLVLGEHQQARRLAIQPMDDEGLGRAAARPRADPLLHEVKGAGIVGPWRGGAQQSGWLVQDDDVIVLEHDARRRGRLRGIPPRTRTRGARRPIAVGAAASLAVALAIPLPLSLAVGASAVPAAGSSAAVVGPAAPTVLVAWRAASLVIPTGMTALAIIPVGATLAAGGVGGLLHGNGPFYGSPGGARKAANRRSALLRLGPPRSAGRPHAAWRCALATAMILARRGHPLGVGRVASQ